MNQSPLGKKIEYKTQYDSELLFPINRIDGRAKIGYDISFNGYDIWNCYEVSWLNTRGKPEVRIMHLYISCKSPRIVESKSLKLYLNSFNNTKFSSENDVIETIKRDISSAVGTDIEVEIKTLDSFRNEKIEISEYSNIDHLDVSIDKYEVNPEIIETEDVMLSNEKIYSNLLRSNCLVTHQPDFASIFVSYSGKQINHESLLKYFISFRNHIEFHEQCVERIFTDIMNIASPSELTIQAKYTRRGGIDICPIRSTLDLKITEIDNTRLARQ